MAKSGHKQIENHARRQIASVGFSPMAVACQNPSQKNKYKPSEITKHKFCVLASCLLGYSRNSFYTI